MSVEIIDVVNTLIGLMGLLATIFGWRLVSRNAEKELDTQTPPPNIVVEKRTRKLKDIIWGNRLFIGALSLLVILLGIRLVMKQWTTNDAAKESRVQTDVGNETETGMKQWSPINEANKEPVTQSLSEETDDNQTRKVEFSRLMGILRDLGSSSARLSFIKANIDVFPDSLSLNELHSILALFSYTG